MQTLRLKLLGAPELSYGEQPVKLPTRKALALLIYLVVEGGFHSREKLVALFWPESPASLGFAALRNTLARLRAALRPAGPLLLDHNGLLAFDFATGSTLDLQLIETAVQTSLADQVDIATLQAATRVYRADFLEGFSLADAPAFDDWTSVQRERWHHQIGVVFEALSRQHEQRRDFEQALATAIRWLTHDRLNEAAYRRLMQLHELRGDHIAALRVYAACQAAFQAELGMQPSAETTALAQRIRRIHSRGGRMGETLAAPVSSGIPQPRALNDPPFVGRAMEHTQLTSAYRAVQQGQTKIVVIQGNAGVGKTRLATEFLHWLVVQGADVLVGRAFEAVGRVSYQPIVEALRQRLEQENAPDDLLSDIWLAELSRLLPELHDRYPDLPAPSADATLARARLPEAVARLGQALAARSPVVLFIDDIQWADAASLDLLHYLARAWAERGSAVLILLTLRSEARRLVPALEAWLSSLERTTIPMSLSLVPLTARETTQLAEKLVGAGRGERTPSAIAFADWLFRETAGQPLFIAESLKTLLEQGVLQLQTDTARQSAVALTGVLRFAEGQALPLRGLVPAGVRQMIVSRLERLTPTARTLLTAAAVLGRDCDFAQLCRVTDLSERDALPALDELLSSQLLQERSAALLPYRFGHDKIREVVYTEASDARRRMYHRNAIALLKDEDAPAADIAHHALAARLLEPAFQYSVAAGDAAMALFALPNAIAHYEQARALLAKLARSAIASSPTANGAIHQLYAQLSRAYELQDEYARAEAIAEEMLAQARATQQPRMACAALNRLASLAIYSQQIERANALLAEARQIAEASGDRAGLAQTVWSLGQLTQRINDFVSSRRHSEQALALARALGDQALISGASSTLAFALHFLGQTEEAAATMERARAGFVALGNRALEADALVGLAHINLFRGAIAASVAAARSAYALSREIDNAFTQVSSQTLLACALVDQGAYEEAMAIAERNLAAVQSQKLLLKRMAALAAARVFWAVGNTRAMTAVLQAIHPLLIEAAVPGYLEQHASHLCAAAAWEGQWVVAYRYAREALAYRDYHALPHLIVPHWPETEALLRGGDSELACEDIQRWGELAGHVPRYRPLYLRALALVAQWQGHLDQAIAHVEEAQGLAAGLGLPGEQWQLLAKLGELYQAAGQVDKAQQMLTQANKIVQALAANIGDEQLRLGFLAAAHLERRVTTQVLGGTEEG